MPYRQNEMVPITAALHFSCEADKSVHELTPGRCPDGSPRIKRFERRPHGDHNPRHGGLLFMSADQWHHLEGTFVRAQHLPCVFLRRRRARSTSRVSLHTSARPTTTARRPDRHSRSPPGAGRDGNMLQVTVPGGRLPINLEPRDAVQGPEPKAQVFDFTFTTFSREM